METYFDPSSDDNFNPSNLYADQLPSWREYWNEADNVYSNLASIIEKLVLLPDQDLFIPLIASYIFVPTRVARCLPILACVGKPGSGKTNFAKLANAVHGKSYLFTVGDTFAAIRNALEEMRYSRYQHATVEKEGAILCWDNIRARTLTDNPQIYQLLLIGYDHRTAQMLISGGKRGKNYKFNTFCPKVISSVDPLHSYPEFSELARRLWVIPHKPYEQWSNAEKANNGYVGDFFSHKIEFEGMTWQGMSEVYYDFWDKSRYVEYVQLRSFFAERTSKERLNIPEIMQGSKWDISIDPMVTGLLIGTWNEPQQAIDHLAKYYQWQHQHRANQYGATIQHLKDFVERETKTLIQANQLALFEGKKQLFEIVIEPRKLKSFLNNLTSSGYINDTITTSKLKDYMEFLGYELHRDGWKPIKPIEG